MASYVSLFILTVVVVVGQTLANKCQSGEEVVWKDYNKKHISGHNDKYAPTTSLEQCRELCLNEKSFDCKSVEFKANKLCYLAKENSRTAASALEDNAISILSDFTCETVEETKPKSSNKCQAWQEVVWQDYSKKAISRHNDKMVPGTSLEQCRELCLKETSFECLSVELISNSRCNLAKVNSRTPSSNIVDHDISILSDFTCKDTNKIKLALGSRPVSQSSVLAGGVPKRAVDGNKESIYTKGSCTHTKNENQPWWEVDLGANHDIYSVSIVNRADCCAERLSHFKILVTSSKISTMKSLITDSHVCAEQETSLGSGETKEIRCTQPKRGRYVSIMKNHKGVLTLCEVEVYTVKK